MATVLNLITTLEPDGAQIALLDVLGRLAGGRHTIWLAFLRGAGSALPARRDLGVIRVVDLGRGGRFDPAVLVRLVRLIRRERIDVVHTHLVHAGVVGKVAARVCRVPSITTRHYASEGKERKPAYRLEDALTRGSAVVVAVSNAVERHLIERRIASAKKIVMIPNGIDTHRFDPARVTGRPRTDGGLVIGSVGRLVPQKGHRVLLDAFRRVIDRRPDARLEIAGEGPLRAALQQQARRLGLATRVHMGGAVPHEDLSATIAGWDLFAMPSLWEGFGIAAAEAMAMERPVVASNVEGLSELIEHGSTGVLVPPNDPMSLANALLALIEDPERRAEMGRRGRDRIVRSCSIDPIAGRVSEIYDRFGAPRPRSGAHGRSARS